MGKLAFPLDPKLTAQDRVILNILQKEYELHGDAAAGPPSDADEDSDDSGIKHSEIVTASPEGTLLLTVYPFFQILMLQPSKVMRD